MQRKNVGAKPLVQSRSGFIELGNDIMALCEFIRERRNIRDMLRGIWLAYGEAHDERGGRRS